MDTTDIKQLFTDSKELNKIFKNQLTVYEASMLIIELKRNEVLQNIHLSIQSGLGANSGDITPLELIANKL